MGEPRGDVGGDVLGGVGGRDSCNLEAGGKVDGGVGGKEVLGEAGGEVVGEVGGVVDAISGRALAWLDAPLTSEVVGEPVAEVSVTPGGGVWELVMSAALTVTSASGNGKLSKTVVWISTSFVVVAPLMVAFNKSEISSDLPLVADSMTPSCLLLVGVLALLTCLSVAREASGASASGWICISGKTGTPRGFLGES